MALNARLVSVWGLVWPMDWLYTTHVPKGQKVEHYYSKEAFSEEIIKLGRWEKIVGCIFFKIFLLFFFFNHFS